MRAVCVDVRQRGFRTKRLIVVTTLRDPVAYPAPDLAALYRRRWQAEMSHSDYSSSATLYRGRWAA
jgi:hypothetical protein